MQVDRAADAICESLGIESHSVGKQIFLLRLLDPLCRIVGEAPAAEVVVCEIAVTFLKGSQGDHRDSLVCARSNAFGHTSFSLSIASLLPSGERIFQESALSSADAARLLKTQADPELRPLRRPRVTFLHDGRAMMLDHCTDGVLLLRVERLPGAQPATVQTLSLPAWLATKSTIEREVTGDPAFLYKAMAERNTRASKSS